MPMKYVLMNYWYVDSFPVGVFSIRSKAEKARQEYVKDGKYDEMYLEIEEFEEDKE